jgi:nicotinate-nucleotide pyrophosphorylase (carboxylating)
MMNCRRCEAKALLCLPSSSSTRRLGNGNDEMTMEHAQVAWDSALTHDLRQILRLAISEDLARGFDITSVALVPGDAIGRALVVAREDGVVAGVQTGAILLDEMASNTVWTTRCQDGDAVGQGDILAEMEGPARDMLVAERTLLNTIGHLSGVASQTRRFVDLISKTKAQVCDTRKTLPGWRRLEKFAVRCGGGVNHRLGLYDGVLIKDNHLVFGRAHCDHAFTIAEAVEQARAFVEQLPQPVIVQVEVDSLQQLEQALPARPDMVLLDNMAIEQLESAVLIRDKRAPEICLEASGGVRLDSIRAIARTGVDRISVGALTHSARQLDVGLDWCEYHSKRTTNGHE